MTRFLSKLSQLVAILVVLNVAVHSQHVDWNEVDKMDVFKTPENLVKGWINVI